MPIKIVGRYFQRQDLGLHRRRQRRAIARGGQRRGEAVRMRICRRLHETVDHPAAVGKSPLRILRQGFGDRGLIGHRQPLDARRTVQVLRGQLCRGAAVVRQHPGEHLLVDDRQAVLIAVNAWLAVE